MSNENHAGQSRTRNRPTSFRITSGPKNDPPAPLDPSDATGEAPAFLSVDELATLLRLDRKTVYEQIRRGEIPGARRVGRVYRILRTAVISWFTSGKSRDARPRRDP